MLVFRITATKSGTEHTTSGGNSSSAPSPIMTLGPGGRTVRDADHGLKLERPLEDEESFVLSADLQASHSTF
ncbi:hypothetical protein CTZ28_41710 [Streptomyces shenzhenensis]|uniref:Uncharacterized protein n=1 Tax=Streptomyces shenzhenensis TaxID=943815 RepID=A0A3M0HUF8_9ACTN|nr:hypothetical protein CTZ28_41710 [Streptomyces shenzhenensis]